MRKLYDSASKVMDGASVAAAVLIIAEYQYKSAFCGRSRNQSSCLFNTNNDGVILNEHFKRFTSLLPTCVYTAGKWTKCNAIIPHYNADPNVTFGISLLVILVLLSGYGIYRAFFNNKGLTDQWDDHDD